MGEIQGGHSVISLPFAAVGEENIIKKISGSAEIKAVSFFSNSESRLAFKAKK